MAWDIGAFEHIAEPVVPVVPESGGAPVSNQEHCVEALVSSGGVALLNTAMPCVTLGATLDSTTGSVIVTKTIINLSGVASYTDGSDAPFTLVIEDGVVTDVHGDQAICDVLASDYSDELLQVLEDASGGVFTGLSSSPSGKTVNGFAGRFYGTVAYSDNTTDTFGAVFDGYLNVAT